jgi:hypothetical protein
MLARAGTAHATVSTSIERKKSNFFMVCPSS